MDYEQLESNYKLFSAIRKKDISLDRKIVKINNIFEKSPKPNINAQDGNDNDNTPLHSAAIHSELDIIKLILFQKPDANIKNRNGYTPLELAININRSEDVITLLELFEDSRSNSDAHEVTSLHHYIKEYDVKNEHGWSGIQTQRKDSTFKILKITNCSSIYDGLKCMLQESFYRTLNEATHWFMIILQISETETNFNKIDLNSLEKVFDRRKPLIVQWKSKDTANHAIFFKYPGKSFELLEVIAGDTLTEEILCEKLSPEGIFKFPLLLEALYSNLGGNFKDNLLDVNINVVRTFNKWKLIDYASRDNDVLSLRFLLLFNWNLAEQNQNQKRPLEIAAQYAYPETFSALLNLPIINNGDEELYLTKEQSDILSLANSNGRTSLLIAAQIGKAETLRYLIRCGADINTCDKLQYNAIELAIERKRYDNVLTLIDAEALFPNTFKLSPNDSQELQLILEKQKGFHDIIIKGQPEDIHKFLNRNFNFRYAYNTNNQSALTTALRARKYEVYALLISRGFSHGSHECQQLSDHDKLALKEEYLKYFRKEENSHIIYLLSKSRLGYGSQNKDFTVIRNLYEKLDDIPEISNILKVIEHCETLEIVFDFNKESVIDMGPTATSTTLGICDGRIYIGAKCQNDAELLGTIAHEFTHLAMQIRFDNHCNPYSEYDVGAKVAFNEIINLYRRKYEVDLIIQKTFTMYNPSHWPSELIVRVPQLWARYKEQKNITYIENEASELFKYYKDNIEKELQNLLKDPAKFKNQHKIKLLNDQLGQLEEIDESKIKFRDNCFNENVLHINDIAILSSNLPKFAKFNLYRLLSCKKQNVKNHYIFTAAHQFNNERYVRDIVKAYKSASKPFLVVDCSRDYYSRESDIWETINYFTEPTRIIFIAEKFVAELIKNNPYGYETNVNIQDYTWSDLSPNSQENLLDNIVNFQGSEVKLSTLITGTSPNVASIPLTVLLEARNVKIGEPLSSTYGYDERYYIPRKIKFKKDDALTYHTSKDLNYLLENHKLILISDIAGTGKTTVLTHLSKKIKELDISRWVIRINLSDYIDALQEQSLKPTDAVHFLTEKILKITSPLSKAVFRQCLEDRKIILMLDGFDQITPTYDDTVIKLLQGFKKSTVKQLWLTSRSFLEKKFEDELEAHCCTLKLFCNKDQVNFLSNYWEATLEIANNDKIKKFAKLLLAIFTTSISNNEFAGIPLQTHMLAKVFLDDCRQYCELNEEINLPEQLDIITLYERFLNDKYSIYVSRRNNYTNTDKNNDDIVHILKDGINLNIVHQHLALEVLFPQYKSAILQNKNIEGISNTELNRIGIVQYCNGKLQFVHRTFAEYYVAQYLLRRITDESHKQDAFLIGILIEKNMYIPTNQIIRKFFNGLVAKYFENISETILKKYGIFLSEISTQNNFDSILSSFITESKDICSILCIAVYERNGYIMWLISQILSFAEENNSNINFNHLLEYNTEFEENVWHAAATVQNNPDVIEKLLTYTDRKFLTNQLLRQKNKIGEIPLHIAASNNNIEMLMQCLKTAGGAKEQQEMLLNADIEGRTPLMHAVLKSQAYIVKKLLQYAAELGLEQKELQDILLQIDNKGKSLLHHAILIGNIQILETLWEYAIKIELKSQELHNILIGGENDTNLWQIAILDDNVIIMEKLWEYAKQISANQQELLDLLLKSCINGKTPIMNAVLEGHVNVLNRFWEYAKEIRLQPQEIRDLLLSKDVNETTLWMFAAGNGHLRILNQLWIYAEEVKLSQEDLCNVFLSKDIARNSLCMLAIRHGKIDIIKELWNYGKNMSPDKLRSIFFDADINNRTVWWYAVQTGDLSIINQLWEYAKKIKLDDQIMRNMLFDEQSNICPGTNINNKTPWIFAVQNNNREVVELLWEYAKEIVTKSEELYSILLSANAHIVTPNTKTALVKKLEMFEKLKSFAKEVNLNPDKLFMSI